MLTYYVLEKVSKTMLLKKSLFMEDNKELLGLVSFEFLSLTSYETKKHNDLSVTNVQEKFEESFEMQDNDEIAQVVPTDLRLVSDMFAPDMGSKAFSAYDQASEGSNAHHIPDSKEESKREASNFGIEEEDHEMRVFMQAMKEPVKKPTYRGELFYDFKKYQPKTKFIGL